MYHLHNCIFLFLCYSHKNKTRQITQSTKSSMPQGQQGRVLHWPAKAAMCCRLLLQLWLPRQVAEALCRRAHRSAHTLPILGTGPATTPLSSVQQTTTNQFLQIIRECKGAGKGQKGERVSVCPSVTDHRWLTVPKIFLPQCLQANQSPTSFIG